MKKTLSFTSLLILTVFIASCGGKPWQQPKYEDIDLTEGKQPIYSDKRGIIRRR